MNTGRIQIFGVASVLIGMLSFWWNWHTLTTNGEFSIKLVVLAPLGIFGGVLMVLRPEWSGPWQTDAGRNQKAALIAVILLTAIGSAVNFYFLSHYRL